MAKVLTAEQEELKAEIARTCTPALSQWLERYGADPRYELEARLRGIDGRVFDYMRRKLLQSRLHGAPPWREPPRTIHSADASFASGLRATTSFDGGGGSVGATSFLYKLRGENADVSLQPTGEALRLACSTEEAGAPPGRGEAPASFRLKRRWRFDRKGMFLYELTEVQSGASLAEARAARPTHEVELEWIGRQEALERLREPGGCARLVDMFVCKLLDLVIMRRAGAAQQASTSPQVQQGADLWDEAPRARFLQYCHDVEAGLRPYAQPPAPAPAPVPAAALLPAPSSSSSSSSSSSLSSSLPASATDDVVGAGRAAKRLRPEPAAAGAGDADAAAAQKVASAYDQLADQGRAGRERSGILHLRNLNNWVKATLIRRFSPRLCRRVLDLACGKAGDLQKWLQGGLSHYVGVDISRQAVHDAASRFNDICGGGRVHAKFARADLGVTDLGAAGVLGAHEQFDAISIQFALHYLFQTEQRALSFFRNIAGRLAPGGVLVGTIPDAAVLVRRLRDKCGPPPAPGDVAGSGVGTGEGAGVAGGAAFGNSICTITFPAASVRAQWGLGGAPFGVLYNFYLDDKTDGAVGGSAPVDHVDEYLVPRELLERLARAAGLRPLASHNFHEWFPLACGGEGGAEARDMLGRMRVLDCEGSLPPEDWEVAGLYRVFAFELAPPNEGVPPATPILEQALAARAARGNSEATLQFRKVVSPGDILDTAPPLS